VQGAIKAAFEMGLIAADLIEVLAPWLETQTSATIELR
jgi:hypothetical protein